MYDVEFREVRLRQSGPDVVRLGPIGSGGVISHTVSHLDFNERPLNAR